MKSTTGRDDHAPPAAQSGLFSTPLTHELDDVIRRSAGHETRDVVEMNPAALRDFIAGTRFGAIRDFAGENVMVLLLAAEIEEMFGRFPGQPRFLLEFTKRGNCAVFPLLEDSAR